MTQITRIGFTFLFATGICLANVDQTDVNNMQASYNDGNALHLQLAENKEEKEGFIGKLNAARKAIDESAKELREGTKSKIKDINTAIKKKREEIKSKSKND